MPHLFNFGCLNAEKLRTHSSDEVAGNEGKITSR